MSSPKPRFLSLDVFRGATVCLMIIVNSSTGTGTDPFPWLVHARWIGFTAADWVFPTFLFVVGNSMSFGDPRAGGESAFLRKTLKRTAILFLLGFLLYWYPIRPPRRRWLLGGHPTGRNAGDRRPAAYRPRLLLFGPGGAPSATQGDLRSVRRSAAGLLGRAESLGHARRGI